MKTAFAGFPPEAITFLRAVKRNNRREWFQENKWRYERFVKEPGYAFTEALRPGMKRLFPHVSVGPKSMSRIYRDTRFSADKSPYKTWMMFGFDDERVKGESTPGFYLGYDPTGLAYGGGLYHMTSAQRDLFRARATDPVYGKALARIARKLRASGRFEIRGRELKRMPPGYDPKHPNAEFLLHNGIYAFGDRDMPKDFYKPELVKYLLKLYGELKPFHEWVVDLALAAPRPVSRFLEDAEPARGSRDLDEDAPAWA